MNVRNVVRIAITMLVLYVQCGHTLETSQLTPTFKPHDMKVFSGKTKYYRYLVKDEKNRALYVGAMDYVYRLNLDDISRRGDMYQESDNLRVENPQCWVEDKDFACKNHIRMILPMKNKIYVCGTGAMSPVAYYLDNNLKTPHSLGPRSGERKCPYDPADNTTCIWVESGNPDGLPFLYCGTIDGVEKLDPVINRSTLTPSDKGDNYTLRTKYHNTNWLNDPQFVGAFDEGDKVYFFYREIAVETSERVIYSRVARVCKGDLGGGEGQPLENSWTTYLKARLNCSIPGVWPYYFNEIHDVYRTEVDGTIVYHAVFTTSANGLYGSAVCSFTLEDIDAVFEGKFQERKHPHDYHSCWQPVPDHSLPKPRPGACQNSRGAPKYENQLWIGEHPLMYYSVRHRHSQTMFYEGGVLFQRLVVDQIMQYTVFFLGTNQGAVHKVVQWQHWDGSLKYNMLALWKPANISSPIWNMKLFYRSLYLAQDSGIIQIPVYQCKGYTCQSCIRDPYCGWDAQTRTCRKFSNGIGLVQSVESDTIATTMCPVAPSTTEQADIEYNTVEFTLTPTDVPSTEKSTTPEPQFEISDIKGFFQSGNSVVNNGVVITTVVAAFVGFLIGGVIFYFIARLRYRNRNSAEPSPEGGGEARENSPEREEHLLTGLCPTFSQRNGDTHHRNGGAGEGIELEEGPFQSLMPAVDVSRTANHRASRNSLIFQVPLRENSPDLTEPLYDQS